ncbi:MAG: L-threonylcarbamoyladenylate synthase [Gammaproteobacteria bacterium]|nr:L-threonylcarbamoyladenylate synthase [Gammaproteobacteria bacterium]
MPPPLSPRTKKYKNCCNLFVKPDRIQQAVQHIAKGGIVAYPTEGVFGLGCDPCNVKAVKHLLRIKRRPASKGLILIASDPEQLKPFVETIPAKALATWPGPVTWILPARSSTPRWLTGKHDSIAVRVTAHPIAAALCKAYGGALVSTSANRSGQQPALTFRDACRRFNTQEVLVIPGQVQTPNRPSTIMDGKSDYRLR